MRIRTKAEGRQRKATLNQIHVLEDQLKTAKTPEEYRSINEWIYNLYKSISYKSPTRVYAMLKKDTLKNINQ